MDRTPRLHNSRTEYEKVTGVGHHIVKPQVDPPKSTLDPNLTTRAGAVGQINAYQRAYWDPLYKKDLDVLEADNRTQVEKQHDRAAKLRHILLQEKDLAQQFQEGDRTLRNRLSTKRPSGNRSVTLLVDRDFRPQVAAKEYKMGRKIRATPPQMAGPQVDSSLTKQNYETEVFQHQVKNKITPTMRLPLELHTRTVGLPNYIEKTLMDIYGPVATVDKTRVPAGVVYRRPDVPLVTFEQLKQYPADFNPDVLNHPPPTNIKSTFNTNAEGGAIRRPKLAMDFVAPPPSLAYQPELKDYFYQDLSHTTINGLPMDKLGASQNLHPGAIQDNSMYNMLQDRSDRAQSLDVGHFTLIREPGAPRDLEELPRYDVPLAPGINTDYANVSMLNAGKQLGDPFRTELKDRYDTVQPGVANALAFTLQNQPGQLQGVEEKPKYDIRSRQPLGAGQFVAPITAEYRDIELKPRYETVQPGDFGYGFAQQQTGQLQGIQIKDHYTQQAGGLSIPNLEGQQDRLVLFDRIPQPTEYQEHWYQPSSGPISSGAPTITIGNIAQPDGGIQHLSRENARNISLQGGVGRLFYSAPDSLLNRRDQYGGPIGSTIPVNNQVRNDASFRPLIPQDPSSTQHTPNYLVSRDQNAYLKEIFQRNGVPDPTTAYLKRGV